MAQHVNEDSIAIEFILQESIFNSKSENNKFIFTGRSVALETFKFYVSEVFFSYKGKTTFIEENSYHLIDFEYKNTLSFWLTPSKEIQYDHIHFNLGIDSLTNVSGALDGDLDPTKGMYWTWQSGYINLKMEGKLLPSYPINHNFEFHLGGYLPPYQSFQKIKLRCEPSDNIIIKVNPSTFFDRINFKSQNNVMSPGKEALKLSILASQLFTIDEKK